ncbi:MAG: hypothetical protein LBE56_14315 [Tannerella sp.]|jgi:hypothetical protein|nr:hypothetical protein [Tannerella sp.]
MNTRFYFSVLIFLCTGLYGLAQLRIVQQETDRNGNVSFARMETDTAPQ